MIRRLALVVVALLLAVAGYLLLWPVPIDPVAWAPPEDPGLTGQFAAPTGFSGFDRLADKVGLGPEDVTLGPDGYLYSGLQDGRIFRVKPQPGAAVETVLNTGGRPLGMQFDGQGNLVVADAFKGLVSISSDRRMTVLSDSLDGKPFLFADDLDIADDGTIWFTDASRRFDQHHWILDFWEYRPTGRLLRYDPSAKKTSTAVDNLYFANGVALGPDDQFVLVNETMMARIVRHWLKGPRAGTTDYFIQGLPGYPDNLSYNGDGVFWVAIPAPRNSRLENLAGRPFFRKLIFRLPESFRAIELNTIGWILGLDLDGKVKYNIRDSSGAYANITSVNEFDGRLHLGSIQMNSIGRIARP